MQSDSDFETWQHRNQGLIYFGRELISTHLQNERSYFRLGKFATATVSFVLGVMVLASLLLAASNSLHERFHEDASQSSHQCAITLFEQQQLLSSEPIVCVTETHFGLAITRELSDSVLFSSHDYRFSASRAPPLSFFSSNG